MSTIKSKKVQLGTDANSSNNFTLYQPATPDGTLRIGVGNADSPTEVGRFTSAGYKPATAPAFSAECLDNISLPNATWVKVSYGSELFDTTNDYDATTNYRFTPSVEGYYFITSRLEYNGHYSGDGILAIYKNGSAFNYIGFRSGTSGGVKAVGGTALIYLNGSTDYIEMYVYQNTGATRGTGTNGIINQFSGYLAQQV